MTFKTENQMNTRASTLPIEECYLVNDRTNPDDNNPYTGLTFDYPIRWINDPSLNKAIGIRRLECVPKGYSLKFHIKVYTDDTDDTKYQYILLNIHVIESNSLNEILTYMENKISNSNYDYQFHYSYEGSTLKMWCTKYTDENTIYPFNFYSSNETEIKTLMEFLNQSDLTTSTTYAQTKTTEMTFNNVWDREKLMFHASFSNSKHEFIGFNGDFYQKISLLYNYPASSTGTFWIRFTTDGTNPIIPYYGNIIIQLTFIINSNKSLIL